MWASIGIILVLLIPALKFCAWDLKRRTRPRK